MVTEQAPSLPPLSLPLSLPLPLPPSLPSLSLSLPPSLCRRSVGTAAPVWWYRPCCRTLSARRPGGTSPPSSSDRWPSSAVWRRAAPRPVSSFRPPEAGQGGSATGLSGQDRARRAGLGEAGRTGRSGQDRAKRAGPG